LLGKTVECPDCRGQIRIVSDGHKGFTACEIDDDDDANDTDSRTTGKADRARARPAAETKASTSSDGKKGGGIGAASALRPLQLFKEPVVVAWTVAIGLALTVVGIIWTSHEERRGEASSNLLAQQPLRDPTSDGVAGQSDDRGSARGRGAAVTDTTDGLGTGLRIPAEPSEQQDSRTTPAGEGVRTSPSDVSNSAAASQVSRQIRPSQLPRAPAMPVAVGPGKLDPIPAGAPAVMDEPATKIDVAAALAQKILSYEQTRGAPLRVMLRELEEMLGVPVRLSDPLLADVDKLLDRSVKVQKMENTTVEEILRSVLKSVGLRYEIDVDGIQLRRGDSS
jgi:hypothetical protein